MKLFMQITCAIVAAVGFLFVGSALLVGAGDAVNCLQRHTAQECRAMIDTQQRISR